MQRQLCWYGVAWLAGVLAINWAAIPILCLGDPKFDGGCGELGLAVAAVLLLEGPLAALGGAILWTAGTTGRRSLALCAAILAALLGPVVAGYVWEPSRGAAGMFLLAQYAAFGIILLVLLFRRQRSR